MFSFDIGPGNYLIDKWVKLNSKMDFDDRGLLSQSGKFKENILEKLLL